MLKIARKFNEIEAEKLFAIYEKSFDDELEDQYDITTASQFLDAKQNFYDYLRNFLDEKESFYAILLNECAYCSALRIEPYRNGFLLTGLETKHDQRGRGYASKLVSAVLEYCKEQSILPLYSHIANTNTASIKVHIKNGFSCISDCAVYLDGSVDHRSKTYCFDNKKTKS